MTGQCRSFYGPSRIWSPGTATPRPEDQWRQDPVTGRWRSDKLDSTVVPVGGMWWARVGEAWATGDDGGLREFGTLQSAKSWCEQQRKDGDK